MFWTFSLFHFKCNVFLRELGTCWDCWGHGTFKETLKICSLKLIFSGAFCYMQLQPNFQMKVFERIWVKSRKQFLISEPQIYISKTLLPNTDEIYFVYILSRTTGCGPKKTQIFQTDRTKVHSQNIFRMSLRLCLYLFTKLLKLKFQLFIDLFI